jgi:hypothetical protein
MSDAGCIFPLTCAAFPSKLSGACPLKLVMEEIETNCVGLCREGGLSFVAFADKRSANA